VTVPNQTVEPPRPRPTTVTVAGWLLFAVAGIQIIAMAITLSQLGTIADVTEDAYRGTSAADGARVSTVVGTIVAAVLGVLFAIAYVVLAIFNNRGKNASRITTWVIGGIGACCGILGLITSAVGNSFNFRGGGDDLPDPSDVQRQINDAVPSWYRPSTIALGVIALLAVVAVLILLALPPSNEFFRKREPAWQPPMGYPPVPGAPGGYPPAPPPGSQPPPPPPGSQPPPQQQ
jgi:uncharacterized membrane protein